MEATHEQTFEKVEGLTRATLLIRSGTSDLALRSTLTGGALARAHIGPAGPEITSDGRTITLHHPWRSWWARSESRKCELDLASDLDLMVEVRGGVSSIDADLRGSRLLCIEIHGGVSGMVLALPETDRRVPITIHGGVSKLFILHPSSSPVSVDVSGGMTKFSADGFSAGAIGGPFAYKVPGDERDAPGYALTIEGGACSVVLERAVSRRAA